jgi:hypothetical protein
VAYKPSSVVLKSLTDWVTETAEFSVVGFAFSLIAFFVSRSHSSACRDSKAQRSFNTYQPQTTGREIQWQHSASTAKTSPSPPFWKRTIVTSQVSKR